MLCLLKHQHSRSLQHHLARPNGRVHLARCFQQSLQPGNLLLQAFLREEWKHNIQR